MTETAVLAFIHSPMVHVLGTVAMLFAFYTIAADAGEELNTPVRRTALAAVLFCLMGGAVTLRADMPFKVIDPCDVAWLQERFGDAWQVFWVLYGCFLPN